MSAEAAPGDAPLRYARDELLADGDYAEPLVAQGVRCHGGFDEDGRYRSPRAVNRVPAIAAWQARLRREGHGLVDVRRDLMPPQYPNLDQAVLLLEEGVREPIVRGLTIISIVEGFGAIIRDVAVPDLSSLVVEPIDETALGHLDRGLFEAHARDEAGHRDQGGHKQMWEAARDLALENPRIPADVLMRMMGPGRRQRARREPLFPELDEKLERMLATMANVLVIEVFAEGTFQWGRALLGNPKVSAEPERAAAMVDHIRSDEAPHVEYLRTALSEVRARTLRRVDGGTLSGREVVDAMMHRILRQLTRSRRQEQRDEARSSLQNAVSGARDPRSLMERFEALESDWQPPATTGFEPEATGG